MNKSILLTVIILTTLFLFSCGEKNPSQNDMTSNSLNKSVESILSVTSISYVSNYEQKLTTDDDTITTITKSEIKRIDEPFVIWSKVQSAESHTNGQTKETSVESYQDRTKNGLELFSRGSNTEWTKSTMDDTTQVNQYIEQSKAFIKACYYLLNTNLDSFKMIENQDGLLKYSGNISQSSVVEAYKKYFREFYINGGLIKGDKELSNKDELLKEITSGEINELMVGIPSLAFSDKSTPIIIWVNAKNNEISKVEINKIDVTQAILNKSFGGANNKVPKVEKSILTYDVLEINTIDEIPMPQ
jgi:hypothetical protein